MKANGKMETRIETGKQMENRNIEKEVTKCTKGKNGTANGILERKIENCTEKTPLENRGALIRRKRTL